ncbi:MAG TPA: GGDEF domain-containing protein [Thermoanaerobaculia bacterium]|nr:GGDEF domain-containing protein [Thermoanaerobaculia bacterium]
MKIHILSDDELSRLLDRHRKLGPSHERAPVDGLVEEILRVANQFVPSKSGSVLIDDPHLKVANRWKPEANELVVVARFGEGDGLAVGARREVADDLVGHVYLSGEPRCVSAEGGEGRSEICVPILLGDSTCGVLELVEREGSGSYTATELELVQIFAGYISTSLQNLLDATRYRELAKRDDLTGLFNDRYFNERLSEEVERVDATGEDLCLIFLDLDHFKTVNDRHGHLVGSQTLREVGILLGRVATEAGATAARYGGDEFVVILEAADLAAGVRLANQIRDAISSAEFEIETAQGRQICLAAGSVTASLGVTSYRDLRFEPELEIHDRKKEFIRSADQAMYHAKARGKNQVRAGIYDPYPARERVRSESGP